MAGPRRWRSSGLRGTRGQALTEYLVIVGLLVLIVTAVVTTFVTPIAFAFARLAQRLVLELSS